MSGVPQMWVIICILMVLLVTKYEKVSTKAKLMSLAPKYCSTVAWTVIKPVVVFIYHKAMGVYFPALRMTGIWYNSTFPTKMPLCLIPLLTSSRPPPRADRCGLSSVFFKGLLGTKCDKVSTKLRLQRLYFWSFYYAPVGWLQSFDENYARSMLCAIKFATF